MFIRPFLRIILLVAIFCLPLKLFSHNEEIMPNDTISKVSNNNYQNNPYNLLKVVGSSVKTPVINYEPVAPPQYWTKGMLTQLGFSQVSLTNWAAGGTSSVAFNAYINVHDNYAKGNVYWDNRAQVSYGFLQSFDHGYRKSDDKIILDSKFGYKAINKFYASAAFNFRTQISPGFTYPNDTTMVMVSKMLSPAYLSLGIGLDYKPSNKNIFTVTFSPLTVNAVIVTAEKLRQMYGNQENEAVRWEVGSQLTANLKYEYKDFKFHSKLALFSDYLNKPQNIQVYWDVSTDYKLTKYLSASLRTNLIYDDNIHIKNSKGESGPRVQFKEVFSLAFSYTFGEYKKQ
jgi:Protein of unknown function (DUF3078).